MLTDQSLLNLRHSNRIDALLTAQLGRGFLTGMMLAVAAAYGMSRVRIGQGGSQGREQNHCQACSERKHAASPLKVPLERVFNEYFIKLSHIAASIKIP
jgi:hypothetical protein